LNGKLSNSIAQKSDLLDYLKNNYKEVLNQLKTAKSDQELYAKLLPLSSIIPDEGDINPETLVEC
jgi:hypothetical protein